MATENTNDTLTTSERLKPEQIRQASDEALQERHAESKRKMAELLDAATTEEGRLDWQKAEKEVADITDAKALANNLRAEVEGCASEIIARAEKQKFTRTLDGEVPELTTFAKVKQSIAEATANGLDMLAAKEGDTFYNKWKERTSYKGESGNVREIFSNIGYSDFQAAVQKTTTTISVNRPRDDSMVVTYNDPMTPIHERLNIIRPIAGGDSYSYIKESGAGGKNSGDKKNNTIAPTAEGAKYNEQEMDTFNEVITVAKLSGFTAVTDEQLSDVAVARSFLQTRLLKNFRQKVESQVINGNGSSGNWKGILSQTAIQSVAKTAALKKLDVFIDALTDLTGTAYTFPDILAMNSTTLSIFAKLKDADGNYIWTSVMNGLPSQILGIPVVVSEHLAANTGLMLTTSEFAFLEKAGIEVEWGYSGDDFLKGQQSIRATCRGNIIAWRDNAAVKITALNTDDAA